ncbi:hypothetical protein PTTG_29049 [Puccinia triticina 1-1 BBBD Race 1]|uniref:Uncharacterized protein n=2 Tax=Puccinia triticina TaxID=208348 RepID=A0A180G6U4_PUCT1|nr:uncharacterized protein PtA15_10A718 [Puccinia triticina]OAV88371.1 hypothetical protein PTTG_29049 [Puccinia triticina 1-1 BBBD Race 1]WAQ89294.1 hypothetical protein PtA15_10A718 [Puccinia triticina]
MDVSWAKGSNGKGYLMNGSLTISSFQRSSHHSHSTTPSPSKFKIPLGEVHDMPFLPAQLDLPAAPPVALDPPTLQCVSRQAIYFFQVTNRQAHSTIPITDTLVAEAFLALLKTSMKLIAMEDDQEGTSTPGTATPGTATPIIGSSRPRPSGSGTRGDRRVRPRT